MKLRIVLTALVVALTGLALPGAAVAGTTHPSAHRSSVSRHACTRRANGKCIKRGQRCAKSRRGDLAWDNHGRSDVCKGRHPHWRKRPAHHACRATGSAQTTGCAIPPTCTMTSTGSCIQAGELCPQDSYGDLGYDQGGMALTCTGDTEHPHWTEGSTPTT